MANSYNLEYIGQQHTPINEYIITSNSNVIHEMDGSGNIIVYIDNNGNGALVNDLTKNTYNHLYIGDEHIASGFGFKNPSDRDYAYSYIGYTLNYANNLNENINEINNTIKQLSNTNNTSSKLSIDQSRNYIVYNNRRYEINVTNDNVLYITNNTSFDIKESKLYFDIISENNVISQDNYISLLEQNKINIPVNYTIKIKKLILIFSHNKNITGFNISCKFNNNNGDITNIDVYDNIIPINENNEVYKIYEYEFNSEIYGNLYTGQFIIDLENNDNLLNNNTENLFINIPNNSGKINFIINLKDENGNGTDIYMPPIFLNYLIYYCDNINNFNKNNSIIYNINDNTVNIEFINVIDNYLYIFIPLYLYNKYNIDFIYTGLNDNKFILGWDENTEINIADNIYCQYKCFVSPYKYNGNMNWTLHFNEKNTN